eukprot:6181325-Pleurochrysis_carterae.AAC.1
MLAFKSERAQACVVRACGHACVTTRVKARMPRCKPRCMHACIRTCVLARLTVCPPACVHDCVAVCLRKRVRECRCARMRARCVQRQTEGRRHAPSQLASPPLPVAGAERRSAAEKHARSQRSEGAAA